MTNSMQDFKEGDKVIVADVTDYPPGDNPVVKGDTGEVCGFGERTVQVHINRTDVKRKFLPNRIKKIYVMGRTDRRFIYG